MEDRWRSFASGCILGVVAVSSIVMLRGRSGKLPKLGAIKKTTTPQPHWKPGSPSQSIPYKGGFKQIDPSVEKSLYPLCISAVVPRPIALISTLGPDGICNMSPFSYFNIVNHDPPMVVFSCAQDGTPSGKSCKDTLTNVLTRKECVIHIMSDWYVESANHTCGKFPAEIDEMNVVNMTKILCEKVKPPRIAEASIAMECKQVHSHELLNHSGKVSGTIVVCEVVMFHIHEGVYTTSPSGKHAVNMEKLRPISRLGGNTYGFVNSTFDLGRPQV